MRRSSTFGENMYSYFRWLFHKDLTSTPWRTPYENFSWNKDTHDELMETIEHTESWNNLSEGKFNILVIGPQGHGKTSLANAVYSLSQEREGQTACANGGASDNVTLRLGCFDFPGRFGNIRFFDSRGLIKERESSECYMKDLANVIEGKVEIGYKFDIKKAIAEGDPHYNSDPTLQDRMHGVIIVFDITEVYDIHPRHQEDIKSLMRLMHDKNIPVFVFLTKADKICKRVRDDITTIYRSTNVQAAVDDTYKGLGIRKRCIHPIVNFEDEVKFKCNEKLPLLVALKHCISTVRNHLYNTDRGSRIDNI